MKLSFGFCEIWFVRVLSKMLNVQIPGIDLHLLTIITGL